MRDLADVAATLRKLRRAAGLSQAELGARAGVPRVTLVRMENLTQGDMSVSALLRLLGALGQELKAQPASQVRTLEDILAEQRGEGLSE